MYDNEKTKIAQIIARRDEINIEEAIDIVNETQWQINDAIADGCSLDEIEDIIADYLGLEPDYLMAFLL